LIFNINQISIVDSIKFYLEIPDPCAPNPCRNEGLCKAELDTYECKCVPGFKGKTCQGMFMASELG
jgi:hypothetical protein